MKKFRLNQSVTFLTALLACGAFLVGAVKIWGVSADRLLSGLITVLLMLVILAVLALAMVVIIKMIRKNRDH